MKGDFMSLSDEIETMINALTGNNHPPQIVEVTKAYSDTSFQKIVELLESAEKMTVPETQIVDKFMTYYLP